MRLADDERGRVPFALIGVLLLVSSGAYVTALGTGADARTEVPTAEAATDAQSVARSVLGRAARGAARDAAARPLVAPADTDAGRAIAAANASPFRAGLELRIAVAAREALEGTEARSGGVTANVMLRERNASALLRSVSVAPRSGGDAMTVRFENLSVAVSRAGRRVATRTYAPTVVVHSPVLSVHDRVRNFTARLDGDGLDSGLPRDVTARLHAIAWARGYAQYGGAPISNVLANRHVGLAANSALLRSQRAAFGKSDPDTRVRLGSAAARTGLRDVLAGVENEGTAAVPDEQVGSVSTAAGAVDRAVADTRSGTEPVVVGVNRSADRAFLGFLDGDAGAVLDDVFSADARRLVRVSDPTTETKVGSGPPPGSAVRGHTERSVRVEEGDASLPSVPATFRSVEPERRVVTITEQVEWRWRRGNETRTTRTVRETTYRVGVRLVVRYGETEHAPALPVATESDDSVYGNVTERAREQLFEDMDTVARTAATESAPAARAERTFTLDRPADARTRALGALADTHERARNVSIRLSPSAAVEENPTAELVGSFERFRAAETAPPTEYEDATAKASLALRRAYAERVEARLRERADDADGVETGVADALGGDGLPGNRSVTELLAPAPRPANASDLSVSARPAYLSLSATEDGSYPLAARNTNLFTVPYGDAADTLIEEVLGDREREYRVSTAARALLAANRTLRHEPNATLSSRRHRLQRTLADTNRETEAVLEARLRETGFDDDEARSAVETGLSRWSTTHERALALSNGTAATAVVRAGEGDRPMPVSRHELAAELHVALAERRSVSLSESVVNETVGATRSAARESLRKVTEQGLKRGADEAVRRLPKRVRSSVATVPSGLPVAPVPGHWYATVNAWDVALEGGYRTLSVTKPTGRPNGNLTYVRTDAPVAVDINGDGDDEQVGANRALTFDVRTGVVVVVPPGGPGVGDGANADERSLGWGPS